MGRNLGQASVQLINHVRPLRPHGLQRARPPCPSPTSRACSNSFPLSQRSSHPLSSSSPPAFNLSQHQGFSDKSVFCIRWPKYWSFSFSISPSNEYSGLISLRIARFYLLAVQGTLRVFSNTTVQKHQFFSALLSL